jgi:hypothetical protein
MEEEVKAVNPLEEAWKNINESLNSVRKDADKVLKQLFSDKKFVENVEKLISLGIAHLGISLASNVKDEKLKQALLEGVRNVLEKSFLNAEAKATV